MKVIGLFRELERGADRSVPSIHSAKGTIGEEEADAVANYLDSGVSIFDAMEANVDPFDPKESIAGGPSLISDGEWIWRRDLSYFVRRYRVGLPSEFIKFALKRGTVSCDTDQVIAKWNDALETYERARRGTST
jgi:hypothetical protein